MTAAGNPLRVLLMSPRTRGERYSGEDAYTDSLLASPPPGVDYVHHDDLIAEGKARRSRWMQRLGWRAGAFLKGSMWIESVETDEPFDLVHIHGYSGYLGGGVARRRTPVLLSESSLDLENLTDYDGWPREKVRRFAARKRRFLRLFGIYDQTLNLRDARHLTVWSEWARDLHRRWGVPDGLMSVIPPIVSDAAPNGVPARKTGAPHFLFVGSEFRRKNGPQVVAAFKALRREYTEARLTIVGEREADISEPAENIRQHRTFPRERIFGELYPQADVFVLPSGAEGYGVAVVEAMSAGLPCVVSGFGALPEVVGETGVIVEPVTVEGLTAAFRELARDPARRAAMGGAARLRYETVWSKAATLEALAFQYRRAVGGGK